MSDMCRSSVFCLVLVEVKEDMSKYGFNNKVVCMESLMKGDYE